MELIFDDKYMFLVFRIICFNFNLRKNTIYVPRL